MSAFEKLNAINVNDKAEQKNGLTYLSWAWAWAEVKKVDPNANYTIYENADGWNYHTDGKTAWVKTGVTVDGIEHIEYLPVMDYKNKSILLGNITSFDVNKAIQRSLTKACARHGLGLYIYAGEDLPEDGKSKEAKKEIDLNTTISDTPDAVKNLTNMIGALEKMGASAFMDEIRQVYGVERIEDIKKGDYRTIVQLAQEKYDLLREAN